jgi:hypothetical protein
MLNIEVNFQECNSNSITHTMYNGTRLFMYVCVCVYVCIMYVCMYVRLYIFMCVYVYVQFFINLCNSNEKGQEVSF